MRYLRLALFVFLALALVGTTSCGGGDKSSDNGQSVQESAASEAAQKARESARERRARARERRAKARERRAGATRRKRHRQAAAAAAATPTETTPTTTTKENCDPSYPDVCLDPNAGDYDCEGGSGDGPKYVAGPIRVTGSDPFDLDADGDGTACDS
jgi:hypothetical protein